MIGVSACRRVGRVGLRSRATGVARLERPRKPFIPNSRVFARVFTFSGRATPDARERGPYQPHADTSSHAVQELS